VSTTGSAPPTPAGASAPDGPSAPPAPLLLERDGPVATVLLNRPAALNALDRALQDALRDALAALADDPSVRAVVLSGVGRGFCAGADLRDSLGPNDGTGDAVERTVLTRFAPIARLLATMPKPTIAAVNGVAAGAGAAMAFACDLRVWAEDASFTTAFAGIGLAADTGASWTLPRLVGPARARELLLRPRAVDAAEADRLGLVTQLVPAGGALTQAKALAAELAAGPTAAYAGIKDELLYSDTHPLEEALRHEASVIARTATSVEHRALVEAFLARGAPTRAGARPERH
jgi:2-(1,2-epoxy-1,2-dihydrophenyl)acetyl-CoA isomerase